MNYHNIYFKAGRWEKAKAISAHLNVSISEAIGHLIDEAHKLVQDNKKV